VISYRINQREKLFTLTYSGDVAVTDWAEAVSRAIAECPQVVTYDSINDMRFPHTFLPPGQMGRLVDSVRCAGMLSHPRRSVSIVGSRTHFGIARMFELASEHESKVERLTTDSIEEAADWLRRSKDLIQAELDAMAVSAESGSGADGAPPVSVGSK